MKSSDFHFEVPSDLIALTPEAERSQSRMMVINRKNNSVTHSRFIDLPEFLEPGTVLVVNDSRVLPARFFGRRKSGGTLEGLLVQAEGESAEVWIKGKVSEGEIFEIEGVGDVKVLKKEGKKVWLDKSQRDLARDLKNSGTLPIPPYIEAERQRRGISKMFDEDRRRYQTIFSKEREGFSVAAPTASLHFDEKLLARLNERKTELLTLSLHVGEGTFAPIEGPNLDEHRMHYEPVEIDRKIWKRLCDAKKQGRRIVAVGTTVTRSLESAALRFAAGENIDRFRTNLFIKPPFEFKMIDSLITNFHWPDSTLIVLVATFCSEWRKHYEEAIRLKYRLFSYGDGMLIL